MKLLNFFPGTPQLFNHPAISYKKPIDDFLVNKILEYIDRSFKDFSKLGFEKAVTGMALDINSIVCCHLLKTALGSRFTPVLIDFSTDSSDSQYTKETLQFINYLKLQCIIVKAGEIYKSQILLNSPKDSKINNRFYYRFINNILLQIADNLSAVLINNTNKTDRLLGKYPEVFKGHIMPFYSFYYSEIYDLASFLKIPTEFIQKAQYYQVWEKDNFGVTIQDLDPVLYLLNEKQLMPAEIAQEFNIDPTWLEKLKKRIENLPLINEASELII